MGFDRIPYFESRFPSDAVGRFAAEPDFARWGARLRVYGLDLRFLRAVEAFGDFLGAQHAELHVVIHNACQTVRRPAQSYAVRFF